MTTHPILNTALLVAAIFATFFAAHTLDMTDHSDKFAQAEEIWLSSSIRKISYVFEKEIAKVP